MALLAATGAVMAQPRVADSPCACAFSSRIDFRGPSSRDRLVVSVGDGPCATASLTLRITSRDGRPIYRFQNQVAHLLLPEVVDGPLPARARALAAAMAQTTMTSPSDRRSLEEIKSGPAADIYALQVSEAAYRRHLRSRAKVFTHPTYHEGGVTIVHDPASGQARVLYTWGA